MQIASLETTSPQSKPSGFWVSHVNALQNNEIQVPNGSKIFCGPMPNDFLVESSFDSWILLVESQSELTQFLKQVNDFEFEIDLYWPRQETEIAWTLANIDSSFKIQGILETPSFNGVRLSKAAGATTDSQLLRSAMMWADTAPRVSEEDATHEVDFNELVDRYHSLLLFQKEARANNLVNAAAEQAAPSGNSTGDEVGLSPLLEENAKLKIQLANSESKVENLSRKYDSLANSKLGRLTLKYWNLRR